MTRPTTGFAFLDEPADGSGWPIAFAHRGGAFHPEIEGLENTLAAFTHAVKLGYRYLETDVHVTRDGSLLAFHDSVLDRVTDQQGAIADLTLAEVRRARVGGREEVPTLAELFDAFPDARFNIDLKAATAVEPLARFVAERNAWDRVLVGSFEARRLAAFRQLTQGRVPVSAAPTAVAAFRLSPVAWLARALTRGKVAALQIPRARGGLTLVTPGLIGRAHAVGTQVHVWVVDEPDEMDELLDLGVDGIFTDRTDLLRDVLLARGQWADQT